MILKKNKRHQYEWKKETGEEKDVKKDEDALPTTEQNKFSSS